MQKYILFTKSHWSEPPRLRHQVANLLRAHGADILFFEKPGQYGRAAGSNNITQAEPGVRTARTRELVHHQLRVGTLLRGVNAAFETQEIRTALKRESLEGAVVVNFNYDYYFLRNIFPQNKIITVINDDFVAQSKFREGAHALDVLGKTCAMSDAVLVVSYPLADQAKPWCAPHLFFPWSDVGYKAPTVGKVRDGVLVWAHINRRIDFDLLKAAALRRPDMKFHIVGPVAENGKAGVEILRAAAKNFIFKDFGKLDELPLDEFFCSAIPYVKGMKDIEAVTMSNKTLQLIARGLPIVTHGMPHFYQHESIFKTDGVEQFVAGLDFCRSNFKDLQEKIESLVSENQATNRYEQLQRIIQD